MPTVRIDVAQRRARLGTRHHLAGRTGNSGTEVANSLIGLHATDPASVYLSTWARIPSLHPDDLATELYDDRTLIRMLGMRRTMFVAPTALAPIIQHSCTDAVADRIRRTYFKALNDARVASDTAAWLSDVEESVVRILDHMGEATGAQLSKAEPRLRTKITYAEGKKYGGEVTITTWVLNMLAAEGRIVRGRPGGSWTGSQYRWSPMPRWLPGGIPTMDVDDARTDLVRRWLLAFGPATVTDIKWWTGWNLGDVRRALADLKTVDVDLDGETGVVLDTDAEPVQQPEPWIALLPALDPTPMGWMNRDWYLNPDYRPMLFDRSGNIGPSIWLDGRIVGGWAQRKDSQIVYRLFEDVGTEHVAGIETSLGELASWHGDVRVTPKFRTPLEKELTAQR